MSDTPEAPAAPSASEGTQEAPEAKTEAAPSPAKKAPTYRKFKVGNEEVSLSDEDIARDYGKWKASDQKFREASDARKSVDSFMKALEEDPESVLSDPRLPINKKKLAEKWLLEQIEAELNPADPRDSKLSEAEKRLKEYEDRDKEAEEAKTKTEHDAVREKRKQAIGDTLHTAMQATQLSKHPESAAAVLREMALYMRAAKERGEDPTPDELVAHVHNNRFHQMYTLAHEFEGEELVNFLGEEIVSRLRKHDLARLKAKREPQATHKNESWADSKQSNSPKKMDSWAAKEHARKVLG